MSWTGHNFPSFFLMKKKGEAMGDFEGQIHPEPNALQGNSRAPLVHLGIMDKFYKRRVLPPGQVQYHGPNVCVLGESQRSSWQRHPRNHEDIEGQVWGLSWGHCSVCAKLQLIALRLWHMLGCVLGPQSGELYRKFSHLPLSPLQNPLLLHLTPFSTLVPPLSPYLPLASAHLDIPESFFPFIFLSSSSVSPLGNTYSSAGNNGSF